MSCNRLNDTPAGSAGGGVRHPAGGASGGTTSPKNSNICFKNHHLGTNIRYYKDFDELPDDTYVRNGQVNFDSL